MSTFIGFNVASCIFIITSSSLLVSLFLLRGRFLGFYHDLLFRSLHFYYLVFVSLIPDPDSVSIFQPFKREGESVAGVVMMTTMSPVPANLCSA